MAASETRLFGIKLGIDPRYLVGGLLLLAAFLFWWNTRDNGEGESALTARSGALQQAPAGSSTDADSRGGIPPRAGASRRGTNSADRGTLRLRAVDASRGDVDPTLRLDLLARVRNVEMGKIGRSIFESEPTPEEAAKLATIKGPKVTVAPLPAKPSPPLPPATPVLNVPLKYYGFAKPQESAQGNRGLFLDGDNVLVAMEGQTIKNRYLVVELTPRSARLEDPQMHQGQTLPVTPLATQQ